MRLDLAGYRATALLVFALALGLAGCDAPVRGRLSTFAAPTNLRRLIGLILVFESPGDVVPGPPGP